MSNSELSEIVRRQKAAKPKLQKDRLQRVGQKADGNVHAVDRTVVQSRNHEAEEVHEVEMPTAKRYVRASSLPGLEPPSGYSIKYVRRDNKVRGDCANLIKHLSEGWSVARKSMFKRRDLPTTRIASHGECIGNDDTVLMIATIEMVADRNAQNKNRQNHATRAVHDDSGLQSVVGGNMPLVENTLRSQSGFMRGRRNRAVQPASDSVASE